ncbi:MAG: hypothetical protein ACOCQQ_00610 [Candidatus Nanoarchaeia archaeon]
MGLSNKKEEQLRKMPLIQSTFQKSKDGRYLVHKTTITTIRPIAYFEKVIENEGSVEDCEVQQQLKATDLMIEQGSELLAQD